MKKHNIKHVVEEIPSNTSLNARLCIYVVVFWVTGAGRRETRICVTLGKYRAKQLELCEEFRRTWYETFTGLQNYIRESVQTALAKNTENPKTTEGFPLAIAGTKEITIKGMGDDRHFALMDTGEVNALLEELGENVKEIAR